MWNYLKNIFGSRENNDTGWNENTLRNECINPKQENDIYNHKIPDPSFSLNRMVWPFYSESYKNQFSFRHIVEEALNEMEKVLDGFQGLDDEFQGKHFESHQFFRTPLSNEELRDQYLKHPELDVVPYEKKDHILDGQVSVADIKSLLMNRENKSQMEPLLPKSFFHSFHSYSSVVEIVKPDGSREVITKVQDSDGNIKTTIEKY